MSKLYDLLYTMIGKLNSSVKTTPQTLTDAEKTQARANIGAMSSSTQFPTVPTKVSAFENDAGYAKKTDIPAVPSKLPNPYALNINGKTYDGSSAVSITVEGGGSGGGAQSDWSAAEGQPGHVLNRTHWAEGGDVLLSHTITDNNSMRVKAGIGLVAGNEYTITVNGVEDTYVAQEVTEDGFKFVVLTTPEWKIMDCSPEAAALSGYGATFNPYAFSGSLPVTITITTVGTVHKLDPKFLPDGVPYVEDSIILPETKMQPDENSAIHPVFSAEIGSTVTVNWNGTAYDCFVHGFSMDAPNDAAVFGNGALLADFGITDENNAPFLGMIYTDGSMSMIAVLDGSTEVTVSITGEVSHKLNPRLLPTEAFNNVLVVHGTDNGIANHNYHEIVSAVEGGKAVLLIQSKNQYAYSFYDQGNETAYFSHTWFNGANFVNRVCAIDANGIIQEFEV